MNSCKDIILKNISEFKLGNGSAWMLFQDKFFKLCPKEAPGHKFLISNYYVTLAGLGMVAPLEKWEHFDTPITIKGRKFCYVYVFSKLSAQELDISELFNAIDGGEYWWIDDLYFFFYYIQIAGFAYFDIDWNNLCTKTGTKSKKTKIVFYDVDSACPLIEQDNKLDDGNKSFHTLFYELKKEFKEKTIRFFNVATLSELYIATVFAYVTRDPLILRKNKFLASSYYKGRGNIKVPLDLNVDDFKRQIIEEFLRNLIDTCRRVFDEKIEPEKSLSKLKKYTRETLKSLRSTNKTSKSKVINSKKHKKTKVFRKRFYDFGTIVKTILVIALSLFLQYYLSSRFKYDKLANIFIYTLIWIVAPIIYILTESSLLAFLGQLIVGNSSCCNPLGLMIKPWGIDTIIYNLTNALPPSLIFWSTKNKKLSVWIIWGAVFSGVMISDVYAVVKLGALPDWYIQFLSTIIATLVSVMVDKVFRN